MSFSEVEKLPASIAIPDSVTDLMICEVRFSPLLTFANNFNCFPTRHLALARENLVS